MTRLFDAVNDVKLNTIVRNYYNILWYAAGVPINDGNFHPLSEKFSTLGAAQAVYPDATALTESVAWHASNKAINSARTNFGGNVYTPQCPTSYKMSPAPRELRVAMCDGRYSGSVMASNNCEINLIGDGRTMSRWRWTEDYAGASALGYGGSYAVMCGDAPGDQVGQQDYTRYSNIVAHGQSAGVFRDMMIEGPSTTLLPSNTAGQQGCYMSGICWASRRQIDNFGISGFYAGVDVVGDHTDLNFYIRNCYYGIYMNAPSTTLYGDITVSRKPVIEACRMACVGFHYASTMASWHWTGRAFLGGAPYIFFKEATPASPPLTPSVNFMTGTKFDSLFVESFGNAVIWDDNTRVNGTPASTLDGVTFDSLTLSQVSDAFYLTNRDRCFFQVGTINGGHMLDVTQIPNSLPAIPSGTGVWRPLFDITSASGILGRFTLSGDIETMLTRGATRAGMFRLATGTGREGRNFNIIHNKDSAGAGEWSGSFYVVPNGTTVTTKDAVAFKQGTSGAVTPAISTLTNGGFKGVAIRGGVGAASPLTFIPVAERGTNVLVNNNGTYASGNMVKISTTAGQLTTATGTTDSKVVGEAASSTGVTFAANGLV